MYRTEISTHHKIELHAQIADAPGIFHRILAHLACHPVACGLLGSDVATIANMTTTPRLIGAQIECAPHHALCFGNEEAKQAFLDSKDKQQFVAKAAGFYPKVLNGSVK